MIDTMSAVKTIENLRRIPSLFDPKALGESLKEVAIDYIETEDSNLQSRWFQSDCDADLFIWTDVNKKRTKTAEEIIKYQLSFFGQIVEWSIFDGVRTGVIIESEIQGECAREIIEFDKHPQIATLAQARRLISYVDELGQCEQEHLARVLGETSSEISTSGLQKHGIQKQKSRTARSTFQALLKWMNSIKRS